MSNQHKTPRRNPIIWLPFVIILVVGIALRVLSFAWNTNLYGDVNLFALTARQVALNGRLEYPMKYDFSPKVAYLTLSTPASQHPPLWPLLAGVIASATGTEETFQTLKWMSEFFGLLLLGLMLAFERRQIPNSQELPKGETQPGGSGSYSLLTSISRVEVSLVALSFAAISPILVDFSANGSPYILSAALILLASILWEKFRPEKKIHPFLAGLLCSFAFLVHNNLIFISLAFFLRIFLSPYLLISPSTPRNRVLHIKTIWLPLLFFTIAFLLPMLPWIGWNYAHFGIPFYSYTTYYLPEQLGLLQVSANGEVITANVSTITDPFSIAQRYALLVAKSLLAFVRQSLQVLGPFCLLLLIFGTISLFKESIRKSASLLVPISVYTLTIFLWATYKFRFLVPLLPICYLLAGYGFNALKRKPPWGKWIAYICLFGSMGWMMPSYLDPEPTLYYGNETAANADLYAKMRPLAEELAGLEAHILLGYSKNLDGGIETVYWHRLPFVAARGMGLAEVQKLACDFDARYIWADEDTRIEVTEAFPSGKQLLQNPPFYVIEIKEPCSN